MKAQVSWPGSYITPQCPEQPLTLTSQIPRSRDTPPAWFRECCVGLLASGGSGGSFHYFTGLYHTIHVYLIYVYIYLHYFPRFRVHNPTGPWTKNDIEAVPKPSASLSCPNWGSRFRVCRGFIETHCDPFQGDCFVNQRWWMFRDSGLGSLEPSFGGKEIAL